MESKMTKAKIAIKGLDKRYLKSPGMIQVILSDAHGIYLSLIDVKKLIGEA